MTRKQRRLMLIGVAGAALSLAVGLILVALEDRIVFARTPTELVEGGKEPGVMYRLGGLVAEGSVQRGPGVEVSFEVSDNVSSLPVVYSGILPDLFREGQGVVVEGKIGPDGRLMATTVLARHDENYVPKEVADALKADGHWFGDTDTAPPAGTPAAAGANPGTN